MVKRQFMKFLLRWLVSCVTMYLCISYFGNFVSGAEELRYSWGFYALAGLVFALVNTVIRPIATLFSLPFLLLTLGVFTLIINIGMMALTIWILPEVTMSFLGVFGSCILISLINFLVNMLIPDVK